MTTFNIALIGGGPMSVYALDRLAAFAAVRVGHRRALTIWVFERSGQFGAGEVHDVRQPSSSAMNRASGQISFAADDGNRSAGPLLLSALRPSFAEWCRRRAVETGEARYDMDPFEPPSRQLHGLALRGAFDRHAGALEALGGVTVERVGREVVDLEPTADGGFDVWLDGDATRCTRVDVALFVTGHAHNFARHRDDPPRGGERRAMETLYPLADNLGQEYAPAGCVIALDGLGLSAIDAALFLTEGRGGRFERVGGPADAGHLDYRRCGREPKCIVAYSRSGYLPLCRPLNQKLGDPAKEHLGQFLTRTAIDDLRRHHGVESAAGSDTARRALDFNQSVLPLAVLEMAFVFYRTVLGRAHGHALADAAQAGCSAFIRSTPAGMPAPDFLVAPLYDYATAQWQSEHGDEVDMPRFDWFALLDPFNDHAVSGRREGCRREWMIDHLRADIARARRGNLDDPLKAACDGVWRDLRGTIAYAADKGGLTERSHRFFIDHTLSLYNRLSNGAGIAAMEKILALIEAGVFDVSLGPGPDCRFDTARGQYRLSDRSEALALTADQLVRARLSRFIASENGGPLYTNLLARGVVREWVHPDCGNSMGYAPGGLELDDEHHPLDRDGNANPALTIFGSPTDGVHFFQSSAARPMSDNAIFNQLGRWAADVLSRLHEAAASETEGVCLHAISVRET